MFIFVEKIDSPEKLEKFVKILRKHDFTIPHGFLKDIKLGYIYPLLLNKEDIRKWIKPHHRRLFYKSLISYIPERADILDKKVYKLNQLSKRISWSNKYNIDNR